MSQAIFKDPIVSVAPALAGGAVGNGTVTIDRLTHFTVAQTYTLTCIAKSPDTLFSVNGSLDGPVGIAIVGTQFYDLDLKIFLTLQQGSTAFEIGDTITFSVINGTDLDQDNIDEYDELPQKNFGTGVKGTEAGDHNLRYLSASLPAYRYIQDLYFQAVTAGAAGNSITIEYLDPVPAVPASLVLQDLTYTAATPGAAGNGITVEYIQFTPATKALVLFGNVQYQAQTPGSAGNSITVQQISGGTAGSELVMVVGNAITVQIEDGVSTANQIVAAVNAYAPAFALVGAAVRPLPADGPTPQTVHSMQNLAGGNNAIGDAGNEVVFVSGSAIQVTLQSTVSTATQVRSKLLASVPAMALVSVAISGVSSNPQTAPVAPTNLTGGVDAYGYQGSERCTVVGNAIKLFFESGKSIASAVRAAFNAVGAATALASCTLVGPASHPQFEPYSPVNLIGGKNHYYSFNHHELTDSGNFFEGNGSVEMNDAKVQGQLQVVGHSNFAEAVKLDDQNANNFSGPAVVNAQKALNELIQDNKITVRVNNETPLTWAPSALTFSDNIIIEFTDTDIENTIVTASSPITIADGQVAYVELNRRANATLPVVVANTMPKDADAFLIAARFGTSIRLWDGTFIRAGHSIVPGEGGTGGISKVQAFDPVSTTLPTGVHPVIDGYAVQDRDVVVFTNLITGNNKAYSADNTATSTTWNPALIFPNGDTPTTADLIIIENGTGFANQIAEFDGTTFKVNDFVRYFSGADYWELSSLKRKSFNNNEVADLFSLAYSGSENIIVDFSIVRGTVKEIGSMHVTTDGTTVAVAPFGTGIGSSGVVFSGNISGSNLHLSYDSDNSGVGGTISYFIRRWANGAGGPGGPPNYPAPPGGGSAAAGSSGQVQYNASGLLAADSNFTWDSSQKILGLGAMQVTAVSSVPIVVLDNISSPMTLFSFDAGLYPFAILEFSFLRNGESQVGRMMITNNGTVVAITVDSLSTNPTGITFDAVIVSGNVVVQYVTTSTGFNGAFKYSMRRWN